MILIPQLAGGYALALLSNLSSTGTMSMPPDEVAPHAAASGDLPTLWAGHQITFGRREVPFKGEVETRMDSFVLARVERDGELVTIEQTACHVRFSKVVGAMVHL